MFDSTACGRSRVVIARRSVSALRGVSGVVGSVLVGGLVRRSEGGGLVVREYMYMYALEL